MAGTAIPVGQLTSLGFQVSFLTKEDMKVVFEGGHDGLDTEEQDGLPHQDFRVCQAVVRMFYGDLVQERLDSPRLNICMRLILDSDLLALSLMGKEGETEKECMENLETVVKLPDTVGNKFRGSEETRRVLERLSKSILLLLRTRDYSYRRKASYLLEKFCVKWGSLGDAIVYFIENYSPDLPSLEDILAEVTPLRQASVIKALAANVSGRGDLVRLFGESPSSVASKHLGVFEQLLFSNFRRSSPGLVLEICCYLSHALQQQESVGLLASCLRLWGDPVIARGYVAREVVHYARVGLALFLHMHRDVVRDNEMRLVEMLAKGLPNHFDSSDGRTVVLAKLFSELVTGTLRRMTNPKETSDSVVMPEEEICHELLLCIHECDRSEMNAFLPPISSTKEAAVGPGAGLDNEEAAGIQDSDDDSDLEPIESLSAPKDTKVKYVRDFLEGLPDMKTHSEVVDAFETLPTIVRHQLKLEHEDVAKEVLDNVFFWENEFDDAKLDLARKAALCSVVETRPEDTLTPLCLLFHQDQVQPYRKCLVLDVLNEVSKNLKLADLKLLSDCAFTRLLLHDETVLKQDTTVRVPLLLFLARAITCLPSEMITEDKLVAFFSAITNLRKEVVDGGVEQTICYAVGSVMAAVGDKPVIAGSEDVRHGVAQVRDLILAVQDKRG